MSAESVRVKNEVAAHGKTMREWYREVYLLSDHWKGLRIKAFHLNGKKCHLCGEKSGLDVHHLNYRSIYDVTVGDLQVLCRACHNKEHGVKGFTKPKNGKLSRKQLRKELRKLEKIKKNERRRKQKHLASIPSRIPSGHQHRGTVVITPKMFKRIVWDEKMIQLAGGEIPRVGGSILLQRWIAITDESLVNRIPKNGTFMSDILEERRKAKQASVN